MKNIVLVLIFNIIPFFLFSQVKKPLFEMTFHIEDAKGNKDSVVWGYDLEAKKDSLSIEFGEDDLSQKPFDDILDVRLVKSGYSTNTPITGKKRIMSGEFDNWFNFDFDEASMIINAKYQPVKIKYDTIKLKQAENSYLRTTILAKTIHVFLKYPPFFAKDFFCIKKQNEIVTDMTKSEIANPIVIRKYEVKGKGIQNIPYLFIMRFDGACYYVTNTKEEEVEINTILYPNPVSERIYLSNEIEDFNKVEIFDLAGRKIEVITQWKDGIDISTYPKGNYFCKIYRKNGSILTRKFVVI